MEYDPDEPLWDYNIIRKLWFELQGCKETQKEIWGRVASLEHDQEGYLSYLNLAMKNTEDMEEKFYNQARKLAKEIKTMNLLLNEHEQIITQQGLEFTEIRKENTRVNALVSNPQPGDHSLNPTVQTRLELLVSQNENMKESQNIMAGEIAEI